MKPLHSVILQRYWASLPTLGTLTLQRAGRRHDPASVQRFQPQAVSSAITCRYPPAPCGQYAHNRQQPPIRSPPLRGVRVVRPPYPMSAAPPHVPPRLQTVQRRGVSFLSSGHVPKPLPNPLPNVHVSPHRRHATRAGATCPISTRRLRSPHRHWSDGITAVTAVTTVTAVTVVRRGGASRHSSIPELDAHAQ